jgi:IS1 family transposase
LDFVGNKKNKQWLIYAYHRESGEIVAYVWGKRDLATVQRLKARLKKLGVQYARIASDHWDSFITAFQCCKQVIGKFLPSVLKVTIVEFVIESGVDLGEVATFLKSSKIILKPLI